ncbi:PNGase F N-terminal domain-containing protein [Fulvivirgaceae bacterium BMA12]|uniref:PNGase F N-terminal domain-containing protein n=1 Tax=Agaribacillus aureus TaxID=3051825 RepID=A0ABT8L7A6_9BACT|nr:PNGase F N-terminal domain-containing protein [Fulvivirgaceae bacterium BMA12]
MKKRHLLMIGFVFAFTLLYDLAQGQKKNRKNAAEIVYTYKNNGKEIKGRSLKVLYKDGIVAYLPFKEDEKERRFVDYNNEVIIQKLATSQGKYVLKKGFQELSQPELLNDTDEILGYKCKKARFSIRSNNIEVWYTNDPAIKASPSQSLVAGLGLILKMVRNGNFETIASDITFRKVNDEELNYRLDDAIEVNDASYRRKQIDARYRTIEIFNREKINFGDDITNPNEVIDDVVYRYSKGTVVLKKIRLPKWTGQHVHAEVSAWSEGDAYDRTGSLFIIPTQSDTNFLQAFQDGIDRVPVFEDNQGKKYQGVVATDDYLPPLELMRFFTSFGAGHFNSEVQIEGYPWADSIVYRQEITDVIAGAGEEVWIGAFIGNYAKNGHRLSLNLKYYPSFGQQDGKKTWVQPIFNTLNIMEMSGQSYGQMFLKDSLEVTVNIPEGLKNLQLRYIATGHGGWGGGDEFNPKLNEIFVDNELVYSFIPWRNDCATFRLSNPASGNFGNGLSSSDLSRSNWCPGTATVPVNIPLNLPPGKHTFRIAIPMGAPEGSSASSWNVSGTLIGDL